VHLPAARDPVHEDAGTREHDDEHAQPALPTPERSRLPKMSTIVGDQEPTYWSTTSKKKASIDKNASDLPAPVCGSPVPDRGGNVSRSGA
jgi:hypothetical protein